MRTMILAAALFRRSRRGYVGGVYSAREQDSSVGGIAVICLGVVHMEDGVQVRVQIEVGREDQGDTRRESARRNEENKRSTAHHG